MDIHSVQPEYMSMIFFKASSNLTQLAAVYGYIVKYA